MKVLDEVPSVLVRQAHERTAHHDELDLVHRVAKLLELVHTIACLNVRIVACLNRSHRGRLIAGVRLGGVLEVGVRSSCVGEKSVSVLGSSVSV